MDVLVHGTFSFNLSPDYQQYIKEFTDAYLACNISITPKAHAVMYHLGPFLDKHQVGLSLWSEQAFESVHAKLKLVWKTYCVKDKTRSHYS